MYKNILVALDGSTHGQAAMDQAVYLGRRLGARLHGVHVIDTRLLRGSFLHEARLPMPCAWVLGHEGQGVSGELEAAAQLSVRIAQPGGEESLNVAAAAAICLHESARRRGATA